MKITAAVISEFGTQFELQDLVLHDPRPDEIVVRMVAAGVCHSDISTRDGIIPIGTPVVLGHEGVGKVESVGSTVTKVGVGDHVLLHAAGCGSCPDCDSGRRVACRVSPALNFSGGRLDGTTSLAAQDGTTVHSHFFGQSSFATHAIANQRNATVLPPDLDLAIAPAFACGIMTGAGTVLGGLRPAAGSSIAVYGAGAVGCAAIMAAAAIGCTKIIAIDLHPSRLALAKELGATHTIQSGDGIDLTRAVRGVSGDDTLVDYAVEATGIPSVAQAAFYAVRPGGSYAQLGFSAGAQITLDLTALGMSAVRIQGYPGGMSAPSEIIPQLIALRAAGRFPVDKLVTHYRFTDINTAVDDALAGKTIKPILLFD